MSSLTPLRSISPLSPSTTDDFDLDALLDECLENLSCAKLEKSEDQIEGSTAQSSSSSSIENNPAVSSSPENDSSLDMLLDECLENLASAKLKKNEDELEGPNNFLSSSLELATPSVPYTSLADRIIEELKRNPDFVQEFQQEARESLEGQMQLYRADSEAFHTQITKKYARAFQIMDYVNPNISQRIIFSMLRSAEFTTEQISLLAQKQGILIDIMMTLMDSASREPRLMGFFDSIPWMDVFTSLMTNKPLPTVQVSSQINDILKPMGANLRQRLEAKYFPELTSSSP